VIHLSRSTAQASGQANRAYQTAMGQFESVLYARDTEYLCVGYATQIRADLPLLARIGVRLWSSLDLDR